MSKTAKIIMEVGLNNGIKSAILRAIEETNSSYNNLAVAKFIAKTVAEDDDIKITNVVVEGLSREDN